MELDKVLASGCRRKILWVLNEIGQTNIMDLVRRVNSTYSQVNPSVQILRDVGVVSEQRFGRVRRIKLERDNPKTDILLHVLKIFYSDKLEDELKKNKKAPRMPQNTQSPK